MGSFLLSQLQDLNINAGLYQDNRLAFTYATPRDTENIKKEIYPIFNNNGLHITTSSLSLLSVDSLGWQMIRNFSLRQRLHLLLERLYSEYDQRMCQEIKCLMLSSLRVQMCLLSSVEFLCLAWRDDAVWFLHLVLKSFSVRQMYISVMLLSLRVTKPSYATTTVKFRTA